MSWLDQLYSYAEEQVDAYKFIMKRVALGGGCALFSQQGTGKTFITMAVLEEINKVHPLKLVAIVAPLTSLPITWEPRLRKTFPRHVITRDWEEVKRCRKEKKSVIFLISFQDFSKFSKKMSKFEWCFCTIDESQGLKARNSGWSRAARRMRNCSYRRLALSGTPIDESPIDVWAQMRFIDHRILGEDFTEFAEKYCHRGGFMGKKWIFTDRKLPEFLKALKPHIFRLSNKFQNLKPVNVYPIPVSMFGRQRELLEEMQRASIIRVGGHKIKAPLMITRKIKEEQITGGFVLTENGDAIPIGRAKERKLRFLIKRLKSPIVVFCKYRHEIELIEKVLEEKWQVVRHLDGRVKDKPKKKKRTKLVEAFQAGKIDALVCQLRTGGVSIEFTRSRVLVFYSMNHSLIDFEQIIARLHRGGQTSEVDVFIIYVPGTIDEEKIDTIKSKRSGVYQVVSHFEKRRE